MSHAMKPDKYDGKIDQNYKFTFQWEDHPDSLAPFVPSPLNIVRGMLQLADLKSNDILYDLGCGDGRILFIAIDEFQIQKAVGYEINPRMVEELERKIMEKGMAKKIFVENKNFMHANLGEASVITLYLTTSGNVKLKPKLEKELKSGSRVVSHDFPIHGWTTVNFDGTPFTIGSHKIFIYQIPDCYKREIVIQRTDEEENKWRRIRNHFTQVNF